MSTTEFLKWVRLLIGSGSLLIPVNKHQFDVCTLLLLHYNYFT